MIAMSKKKHIRIENYGVYYKISMIIYNKIFSTTTTDIVAVENALQFDDPKRMKLGDKVLHSILMKEYRAEKQLTKKNENKAD
jgi:hypothetical protein